MESLVFGPIFPFLLIRHQSIHWHSFSTAVVVFPHSFSRFLFSLLIQRYISIYYILAPMATCMCLCGCVREMECAFDQKYHYTHLNFASGQMDRIGLWNLYICIYIYIYNNIITSAIDVI